MKFPDKIRHQVFVEPEGVYTNAVSYTHLDGYKRQQYAIEAVQKYGAFKGMILACKRILRCHPFAECGYDPVP